MITAEQKAKWVEALRSGKYKQGKFALHRIDQKDFCCLGVLCEVLEVPKRAQDKTGTIRMEYQFGDFWLSHSVPEDLLKSQVTDKLVDMNDSGSKSFTEIADWIEKNIQTDE